MEPKASKLSKEFSTCPLPLSEYSHILLAHGGGGKLSHQLIEKIFLPKFKNKCLETRHDGAVFEVQGVKCALTTDSYVVHPLFFPGGDIGSMAVYGTVNDLAMCGARPLYLSAGFIIEEGLKMDTLSRIVDSMSNAAKTAQVELVTGDTKVVDRGKADGIFINTSGVGVIEHPLEIAPKSIHPGDQILISGDIGRHGMAIMAVREGLAFESEIRSDSSPLWETVNELLRKKIEIHCLRDLTRGGLSSALNEIAQARGVGIRLNEEAVPVRQDVRAACEILGLDPFYVANEGRFVAFVARTSVEKALEIMQSYSPGGKASIIGEVTEEAPGMVVVLNSMGTHRILDMLSGEQLPRIC